MAHANTLPQWDSAERRQRRLAAGLVVSFLLHALVLSLQFGVPGLGLPGLEMPWNQRHAKQTDLNVILMPAPLPAPESVPPAQPTLPPLPALSEATPDKPSRPAGLRLYPQRAPAPEHHAIPVKTAKAVKPKRIRSKPARPKPLPPVIARTDAEDSPFKVPESSSAEPENNPAPVEKTADQPEPTPDKPVADATIDTTAEHATEETARREEEQRIAQEAATQQAQEAEVMQRVDEAARATAEREQRQRDEAAIAREQLETEQKRAEEAARIARETEERRTEEARRAEEAARVQRDALKQEARHQAEENLRREAEETARRQAALAQQEALRREQDEAMRRADEARRQAELQKQEELRLAEEETRRQAELRKQEELRQAQELARRQAEEAAARVRAEELARQKQADELAARQRAEELAARRKTEAEAEAAAKREQERQTAAAVQAASQQASTSHRLDSGLDGERAAQGTLPRATAGGDLAARALNQLRGIDAPRLDTQSSRSTAAAEEAPRRASILGRAPQDVGLAMYVEGWKLKIERMGRLNYTQSSVDKSLVDAVVTVIIRNDGSVQDIRFHRNTGRKELDDAIRRIIRLNERYAAFPPDLARRYDSIEIRRVWNFEDRLRILEEMKY